VVGRGAAAGVRDRRLAALRLGCGGLLWWRRRRRIT
jgi:hypothetical protein